MPGQDFEDSRGVHIVRTVIERQRHDHVVGLDSEDHGREHTLEHGERPERLSQQYERHHREGRGRHEEEHQPPTPSGSPQQPRRPPVLAGEGLLHVVIPIPHPRPTAQRNPLQPLPADRSTQCGFIPSISCNLSAREPPLICFSRAMALSMSG